MRICPSRCAGTSVARSPTRFPSPLTDGGRSRERVDDRRDPRCRPSRHHRAHRADRELAEVGPSKLSGSLMEPATNHRALARPTRRHRRRRRLERAVAFRVETPSTICSMARGINGSRSATCVRVSSGTSSHRDYDARTWETHTSSAEGLTRHVCILRIPRDPIVRVAQSARTRPLVFEHRGEHTRTEQRHDSEQFLTCGDIINPPLIGCYLAIGQHCSTEPSGPPSNPV